jgi:hypothetical protein
MGALGALEDTLEGPGVAGDEVEAAGGEGMKSGPHKGQLDDEGHDAGHHG